MIRHARPFAPILSLKRLGRRSRASGLALIAANAAVILGGCLPAANQATVAPPASTPAATPAGLSAVRPADTATPGVAANAARAVATTVAAVAEPKPPARAQTVFAASLPAASGALADARASLVDGDYRKAQADFAAIVAAYPGTPEAAEALVRQGEAALDDDNFAAAEDALRRFLAANPDHLLAPAGQLLLARALEGQSNGGGAAAAYAQYMASVDPVAAMGDVLHLRTANIYFGAGRIEDAWNELAAAVRDADASGSAAGKARAYDALGARYMEAGNRPQALAAWEVALDSAVAANQPARDLAAAAWRLVTGYQAIGRRDLANTVRMRVINEWPATFNALQAVADLGPENVPAFRRGEVYFNNRRWAQTVSTLTDYISAGAPDGKLDEARYMRAVALTRAGDDAALEALDRVADLHPQSAWAPEALWEAGSLLLRKNDRPAALNRFERLAVNYPLSDRRGQALYWLGKLFPELGNPSAGQRYMEAAASSGYEDFYTFRARAALKKPAPAPKSLRDQEQITPDERGAWEQFMTAHGRPMEEQLQQRGQVEGDARYRRGIALIDAGLTKEGEEELRALLTAYDYDPVAVADVALAIRDRGYYPYSVTLGHRLLTWLEESGEPSFLAAPRVVQKLVLPLAFVRLVVPAAEAKRLDPLLLLGLMKQESWFQPRAASTAEARGLTQFIYETAKTVADELRWPNWTWDDMNRPYVSVPFGAHYLSSLIRDFRGNYYFAVAGYNGGPGNVLGWARGDWNRDVDLFVEGIGYAETRAYVKAVTGNYELYKAIYYR